MNQWHLVKVHSVEAGDERERQHDGADDREDFHDLIESVGLHRQVRIKARRDEVTVAFVQVHYADEVVVDITKEPADSVRDVLVTFAAQSTKNFPLVNADSTQSLESVFEGKNRFEEFGVGLFERRAFDADHFLVESFHHGQVCIHHAVDEVVGDVCWTFCKERVFTYHGAANGVEARHGEAVVRHQTLGPQKEVDVDGLNGSALARRGRSRTCVSICCLVSEVPKPVKNQIRIAFVRFDLRRGCHIQGVFDEEWVELQNLRQNLSVAWTLLVKAHPDERPALVHQ